MHGCARGAARDGPSQRNPPVLTRAPFGFASIAPCWWVLVFAVEKVAVVERHRTEDLNLQTFDMSPTLCMSPQRRQLLFRHRAAKTTKRVASAVSRGWGALESSDLIACHGDELLGSGSISAAACHGSYFHDARHAHQQVAPPSTSPPEASRRLHRQPGPGHGVRGVRGTMDLSFRQEVPRPAPGTVRADAPPTVVEAARQHGGRQLLRTPRQKCRHAVTHAVTHAVAHAVAHAVVHAGRG